MAKLPLNSLPDRPIVQRRPELIDETPIFLADSVVALSRVLLNGWENGEWPADRTTEFMERGPVLLKAATDELARIAVEARR